MEKTYDHTRYEDAIYKTWELAGAFTPPPTAEAREAGMEPYCIIMPPPNANDPLHVGHAMFVTIEDILIRLARMQGKAALWLPGTDHAGIETQYVYEKKLNKQGKSRFSYDRDTLYSMIWDYVQDNSGVAIAQMKKLGASADWSRTKFTLDDDCVDLTLKTFEDMYKEGLITRRKALVNYCTKCGTAYSQLEINHVERTSPLYYVRYRHADDPSSYEVVATTRPEPIFVDTHLAVHPKDASRNHLIGKKLLNPLTGNKMEIIGDEFVDPEFGTGLVKLTPAHDHTDFEVAQAHGLPIVEAINQQGKIVEDGGEYAGQSVREARKQVVAYLESNDLMERIDETYQNSVATCYRCGRDIEPMPLAQFFIGVSPLVEKVLHALDKKETTIHGAGHDKILRHWLNNLKDWNISRQIVWGIRIPVWYDTVNNPNMTVGFLDENDRYVSGQLDSLLLTYSLEQIGAKLQTLSAPADATYVVSRAKPGETYLQETDTFDTWFSSSQWPVNTLSTTDSDDLSFYYPTAVMETGYDILPFWVMRMMLLGMWRTGNVPFRHVYLHGLVRDEKGLKMSKSKGNVINPLTLAETYGADALRMALVKSTSAGQDSSMGESKIRAMRNFTNKLWNAARYVQMQDDEIGRQQHSADSAFYDTLDETVQTISDHLGAFRIGMAAEEAYQSFWHWYCDESIEQHKAGTLSPTALTNGMKVFLKILHPFVPFVTEALWKELSFDDEGMLITSFWPSTIARE